MIATEAIRPGDYMPEHDGACGAVATFQGVVRNRNGGRVVHCIEYECYREMAESEIARIVKAAAETYGLGEARAVHRVGRVAAGETSIFVVAMAPHRSEAFAAVRAIVDDIKAHVPIWKKEHYDDATAQWL